ncbi:ribonuclease H-like domain-containing protein [Bacillus sp. 03113]|uniref:ribonuclease H-like domain-containing protein n=1 Tax=Bacillus sp. 03113 TaxID=2578211 RepID=UPI0011429C6F|nr:ribonuclease H-like domain-containing protein [Bacillus sp. 03113]
MSIKKKLQRLKPHKTNEQDTKPKKVQSAVVLQDLPYQEIWGKENVKPYYFDNDFCLVRETKYPLKYIHGKYALKEFLKVIQRWNEVSIDHPLSAKGYAANELLFFDTETTGLGGGTGNTIFILGHAKVSETNVIVKQHILPQPGSEVPLYQSFLENLKDLKLVTYNGKAFDWPQVKTRHTLIRDRVPALPSFGHFDLYHAARRMWKHRLERLKLSIVEKEILEIDRIEDIPGFLAPMIYFDFVENRNPEGMIGVLKHNEFDILSLITLYTHLSLQLLGLDKGQTAKETLEVGKWFSKIGNSESAKEAFLKVVDDQTEAAAESKHALAFQYKKNKQWDCAEEMWLQVVEQGWASIQTEACIELAKIYEHRKKKLLKAIEYTEKAIDFHRLNQSSDKGFDELLKRFNRLNKKIEKS